MSRSTTAVGGLLGELGRALLPLARIDSPERIVALLGELGWDLPGAGAIDTDLGRLGDGVDALFEALTALEAADEGAAAVRLLELIVAIEAVVSGLGDLPRRPRGRPRRRRGR